MIVPLYAPGEWFAVVTDGSVAVLPASTDVALVTEIWESLRDGGELTDQVQVLLRGGIASVPPFALVSVEGGRVRAIVRGEVTVAVTTPDGTRTIGAEQVSTWTEEIVTGAHLVAVRTPDLPTEGSSAQGELPVLAAVVRAAGVRVELQAAPAAPAVAALAAEPAARARRPRPATAEQPVAQQAVAQPAPAEQPVATRAVAQPAPSEQPAAPVAPAAQDDAATPDTAEPDGTEDHDGLTVLSSDVVALRRQLPDWAGDAVPGPFAVPAPTSPPPAKLLLSSGLVVSLNRPVLLGRAPQVSRVTNREIPRLVTVASPNQDISRTHAEVRMEGEEVVVVDLRSTNGVLLLRQNAGPQRLHPNEPTVVEPGVVVDLGEGVTFTVERGA